MTGGAGSDSDRNLIVGLLGTGVFFSWGPGVAAVISTYFPNTS